LTTQVWCFRATYDEYIIRFSENVELVRLTISSSRSNSKHIESSQHWKCISHFPPCSCTSRSTSCRNQGECAQPFLYRISSHLLCSVSFPGTTVAFTVGAIVVTARNTSAPRMITLILYWQEYYSEVISGKVNPRVMKYGPIYVYQKRFANKPLTQSFLFFSLSGQFVLFELV